jgi:hypothetical protein
VARLLVLEDAGLVIPNGLIAAIEAVDSRSMPSPWLPSLVQTAHDIDGPRRALVLHGGGRVEVPAAMHFVDGVEVLELPDLLQQMGSSNGVIGLALVSEKLVLVCDPNLLPGVGRSRAS